MAPRNAAKPHNTDVPDDPGRCEVDNKRLHAMRTDRLRLLEQITAGLAHELNQPLLGLRGTAETLVLGIERDWTFSTADLKERLQLIIDQTDRMSRIVDHVRRFAHESGLPETHPVQINDVVHSALSLIGSQLRSRGLKVETDLEKSLPVVKINPFSFEEVVIYLLINARDAIEETWQQTSRQPAPLIVVRTAQLHTANGSHVVLEVVDEGPGMSERVRACAFDPFFSTKSPDRGTGLGLAISKAIVEDAGGVISIVSAEGKGTSLALTLPALHNPVFDEQGIPSGSKKPRT